MARTTDGLHSLLSVPAAYSLTQRLIGASEARRRFVTEYVVPAGGERVLDIGCGPAEVLEAMPEVDYVGFDLSPRYVAAARKRFGSRGQFHCMDVSEANLEGQRFDVVLALGVLHHLDDEEAGRLVQLAASVLTAGGRLLTLDNVLVEGQHRVARWLIQRDRGQSVRTPTGYRKLAESYFRAVDVTVGHDYFRVPYTLAFLECREPVARRADMAASGLGRTGLPPAHLRA